jgi:hypothetical protein
LHKIILKRKVAYTIYCGFSSAKKRVKKIYKKIEKTTKKRLPFANIFVILFKHSGA